MRYFLVSFICFIAFHALCQQWTYGIAGSPDITYRWLPKGTYAGSQFQAGNQPVSGYHFNTIVNYNINASLGVGAEVRYSFMGFRSVKGSYETALSEEMDWQSRRFYRFNFAELPVCFHYTAGEGKLTWINTLFLSPAVMFRYHRFLRVYPTGAEDFDQTETKAYGSNFNLFIGIRSGLKYAVGERFHLTVQPEFKTGVRPDFAGAHLWSLGLHAGIITSFK